MKHCLTKVAYLLSFAALTACASSNAGVSGAGDSGGAPSTAGNGGQGGATNGSAGAAGSGTCQRAVNLCLCSSAGTEAACGRVAGCTYSTTVGACKYNGIDSCNAIFSMTACTAVAGCWINTDIMGYKTCLGEPSCKASTQTDCEALTGCDWQGCIGTPTPCPSFTSESACTSSSVCGWGPPGTIKPPSSSSSGQGACASLGLTWAGCVDSPSTNNDECATASTGTGGATSATGTGGASATGGSTGASGTTATGGSTGTGGSSGICDPSVQGNSTACSACTSSAQSGKCKSLNDACAVDANCVSLSNCMSGCSDQTCYNNCYTQQQPSSQQKLLAFAGCIAAQCHDQCDCPGCPNGQGACQSCLQSNCLSTCVASDESSDSRAESDCELDLCLDNTDTTCITNCNQMFPAAATTGDPFAACTETYCQAQCG
jgi:hypothetical protein